MAQGPHQAGLPHLLPITALWCGGADFGSQDASEGCFCGDAGAFVVKKGDAHPAVPHSEWFCSSLARDCGVPQVPFSVVQHTDGSLCFGSKWQDGKTADWWLLAEAGTIDFAALSSDISRIYALDLFVHNVDRHVNNYMVLPNGVGHSALSFDYSRAWLVNAFPPPSIMTAPSIATVRNKNWFKKVFGEYLDTAAMITVLEEISVKDAAYLSNIISGHPNNWLTSHQEDAIINWWNTGMMAARVASILDGIADGSLI